MAKKAGTLAVALTANSTQFDRTLARTERRIRAFSGAAKSAFAAVGIGLGASALIGAGRNLLNTLDNIGKRSDALKISTDRYQMLSYAAERTATSMGDVESAMFRANKTLGNALDGDQNSIRAFARLGLEVDKLKGLRPDQLFDRVAVALNDIADPMERSAAGAGVFGRNADNLNNFLRDYLELSYEAKEMGLIVAEEQVRAAEKINDTLTSLNRRLVVMIANMGVIAELANKIENAGRNMGRGAYWGHKAVNLLNFVWSYTLGAPVTLENIANGKKAVSDWFSFLRPNEPEKIDMTKRVTALRERMVAELDAQGLTADKVVNRQLRAATRKAAAPAAPEVSYEKIASWLGDLARAPEEAAAKIRDIAGTRDTAGSFSLRDLAMTVTQNSPAERTADATEEIASNSKKQTEVQLGLASTVGAAMGMLSEVQTYK